MITWLLAGVLAALALAGTLALLAQNMHHVRRTDYWWRKRSHLYWPYPHVCWPLLDYWCGDSDPVWSAHKRF